jgi:tRNA A-37 threonylcarbamoyl transferase component Bud32
MDSHQEDACSPSRLKSQLSGFKATPSPFFPEWTLERLLQETHACRQIKGNAIRAVYALDTSDGTFFLKLSASTRLKDRWRHRLLPRRRWAEWRNLHRLGKKQIEAARPVLQGERKSGGDRAFLLLTEQVEGTGAAAVARSRAGTLGRYLATLHRQGVFHGDLHPQNIVIQPNDRPCLIDAQEVWFFPWLPRLLRVYNLGRLYWYLSKQNQDSTWWQTFLEGYNPNFSRAITVAELRRQAETYRERYYRSRSKRCCKNSSEFCVVKGPELSGFKRREFVFTAAQLEQAIENAVAVKPGRVIRYQGTCIKIHRLKRFHQDRCLASWKMSRALEVRGIMVPRAFGYYKAQGTAYFLSEFLVDSLRLNDYLSSLTDLGCKRRALKKLALWMQSIHGRHVRQRDLKSSNILWCQGQFYLVDLDGVAIRRLTKAQRLVNLAQLNASLSNAVTLRDRVRFFFYYFGESLPGRSRRRKMYRKIWSLTLKKNTAIFDLDLSQLGSGAPGGKR